MGKLYNEVGQALLQNGTGITKWDDCYYNGTIITKNGSTEGRAFDQ